MDWEIAYKRITDNITRGTRLDPGSRYRKVLECPDYECYHYDYNGAPGYKVTIGKSTNVEIPVFMLKKIFEESLSKNGIYENRDFKISFEKQCHQHPCHVHVIGRIFLAAGIVEQSGSRKYILVGE